MNKLITLKCWNRPIYLYKVLCALSRCRNLNNYDLLISTDKTDANTRQQIYDAIILSKIQNKTQTNVLLNTSKLGCAGHTKFLLEKSFQDKYKNAE